jgi:hypothetical protein
MLSSRVLDLIVDHLHDEPATLKMCCVVSKSWVPRTQRHLFAHVKFHSAGPSFESWMKAFPDPSNSPAHHTRNLQLSGSKVITVAITEGHPWLHSFNHLVDLLLSTFDRDDIGKDDIGEDDRHISFTQLHGLSPTLKSLHIFSFLIPPPVVLDFICSFPLLEDLSLFSTQFPLLGDADEWDAPPTPPKFTGSLVLSDNDPRTTRKLLDLPGGLHFSKISVLCPPRDCGLAKELVSKCSSTLESLRVGFDDGTFSTISVLD